MYVETFSVVVLLRVDFKSLNTVCLFTVIKKVDVL